MAYTIQNMMDFIKKSPVPFQTIDNIREILDGAGYTERRETDRWEIVPGGKYYVTRNGTSIIAISIPKSGIGPFMITASHSDSPMFKIKTNPELSGAGKYTLLNTEKYGGMIMSTWLDRPLSVAGRVIVQTETGLEARNINVEKDIALIPNLAIHMNREVNDNCKYNAQTDMPALIAGGPADGKFADVIAKAAGADEYIGADLYLYNRMEPRVWGIEDDYISAPRLDDLECVYTSLCAFVSAKPCEHINMYCVFDNEEVGSGTRQGADSTFLTDVIERIAEGLKADRESVRMAIASGLLVSADNAHAIHPNHPEKADKVNYPVINGGVVIKYSANQKYTTDGMTGAIFGEICKRAGVPVQVFANRSDMLGGSTLGNISTAHVSIPSVDIGLAQLAMHSSYETAGVLDAEYMVRALTAFYETEYRADGDMVFKL